MKWTVMETLRAMRSHLLLPRCPRPGHPSQLRRGCSHWGLVWTKLAWTLGAGEVVAVVVRCLSSTPVRSLVGPVLWPLWWAPFRRRPCRGVGRGGPRRGIGHGVYSGLEHEKEAVQTVQNRTQASKGEDAGSPPIIIIHAQCSIL